MKIPAFIIRWYNGTPATLVGLCFLIAVLIIVLGVCARMIVEGFWLGWHIANLLLHR